MGQGRDSGKCEQRADTDGFVSDFYDMCTLLEGELVPVSTSFSQSTEELVSEGAECGPLSSMSSSKMMGISVVVARPAPDAVDELTSRVVSFMRMLKMGSGTVFWYIMMSSTGAG